MSSPVAVVTLRPKPEYRREAFENGLKRLGYTIVGDHNPKIKPKSRDDLLVLWNKKRGHGEQTADRWEADGGTVIVAENGYLAKIQGTYYAVSVHGHNGSGWFPETGNPRFKSLGYPIKDWQKNTSGYWLVIGQRGIGSNLMASPPRWGEIKAADLRQKGLPVKYRPHPGHDKSIAPPLVDELRGSHTCVIWSSASGVLSLVEGVPVERHAPHWICAGWEKDREKALEHMAQGQWHFDEISTGRPFDLMRAEGWGVGKWR